MGEKKIRCSSPRHEVLHDESLDVGGHATIYSNAANKLYESVPGPSFTQPLNPDIRNRLLFLEGMLEATGMNMATKGPHICEHPRFCKSRPEHVPTEPGRAIPRFHSGYSGMEQQRVMPNSGCQWVSGINDLLGSLGGSTLLLAFFLGFGWVFPERHQGGRPQGALNMARPGIPLWCPAAERLFPSP